MNAALAASLLPLIACSPSSAQVALGPAISVPEGVPVQEAPELPGLSAAPDQFASGVLNGLGDFDLLSREEEHELALAKDAGDKAASDKLVLSNRRLVVSIAKQYRGRGVEFADLIQLGNEGLIVVVRKFDASRNVKLSTYASWWIKAKIMKHIQEHFHLGNVLTNAASRKLFYSLRDVQGQIEQVHGPELAEDPDFIALFMKQQEEAKPEEERSKTVIRSQDVSKMLELLGRPLMSLDAPMRSDDASGRTFVDATPSDTPRQDDLVAYARRARALERAVPESIAVLARRDPRYEAIIAERIMAEDPKTLEELGQRWDISRERVRQLEQKVKSLLRGELQRRLDGTGELDE